jgi:hypothetical protein
MGVSRRGTRRAGALILIGALLAPLAASKPAAAAAPVASFDWSMPDRFGPDRNGDGIVDYVDGATDVLTGYDATPDSWHVDLDACTSTAASSATFHWTVVDQPNPATPITVQGGPGCADFSMDVPEEGTYRVDLVVETNGEQSAPLRRDVIVQDWLIVALGDSYGSGEGAPDVPIDQTELDEAQAALAAHQAAIDQLTTLQASLVPVQEAIAAWQDAVDRAARFCAPNGPEGDVGKCAQATADIVFHSGNVVVQLVALGVTAVIETIGDAINAIGTLVDLAVQAVEAAQQVVASVLGELSATWQAERCHRSAKSGAGQAAQQLEQADPHTSVTFVHLACSGASIVYGLLGWYQGTEHPDDVTNEACAQASRPAGCVPPQIDVAEQIIGGREVDAAYVSIGGNDAHFADIVMACIVQDDCSSASGGSSGQIIQYVCGTQPNPLLDPVAALVYALCSSTLAGLIPPTRSAPELIHEGINGDVTTPIDPMFPGLANGYASLDAALIGAGNLVPAGRESRVFLSQYVDAVKRDDGALCDFASMGYDSIPFMSQTESAYIDSTVVPMLFGAIEQATQTHGWTYVDGVYDGFTNHGYCAQDHYMVRAQETFLVEGRFQGMVHPNANGYAQYRNALLPAWMAQFYPTGSLAAPRRPDQRPYADAGAATTVAEGQSVTMTNSTWDSDGDAIAYAWSHDRPGAATITPTTAAAPVLAGIDDATGTVSVTVTDADGPRTDTAPFTVTNVAPVIGTTSALDPPVALGHALQATVPFTDAGVADTHTATFAWGDGSTTPASVTSTGGQGNAAATHTYAAAGLYPVTLTITDDDGGSATVVHEYVVVYDAAGGFATGGGWLASPSGAFTPDDSSDPDVTGTARFAFVSKYAKGATKPSGTTAFRFNAADLDFQSTSYDWMVVSGTKATYRGTGTVNGAGSYRFVLAADDSDTRPGGVDRLRVRIWDQATGAVVYDNQAGSALDAAPVTAIGGGQITVHK